MKEFMVSFRVLLVVLVFFSIWIPTAVIVGVSQSRTETLLDDATRLRTPPVAARLRDIVVSSLERAEYTTRINVEDTRTAADLPDLDSPAGREEVRRKMSCELAAVPNATSTVWVTKADGRLWGRYAFSSGEVGWWETTPNCTLFQYEYDTAAGVLGRLVDSSTVNNTGEPFFTLAREHGECWTSPYKWFGDLYLTFSRRASTQAEAFWGVWGADILVADAAMVFQGATIPNGLAILVEASTENVLATTDPAIKVQEDLTPLGIDDMQHPWIRAANRFIHKRYGSWAQAEAALGDDETTSPEDIASHVRRPCLQWVVVVIVRVDKVEVEWASLVTAALTTACAIGCSITFAMLITRPLMRLTRQMEDIAQLKFEVDRGSMSRLTEFQKLEIIFSRLRLGIIAMTKYIPRPVVRDLLRAKLPSGEFESPKKLATGENLSLLGMAPRELTVMFTDIRGFTTLSEVLSKRTTVEMLNVWLEAFTACIHEHSGVVDKYIGDCIMAIWNAPDPVAQHAALACETALKFKEVLARLNKQWEEQELPPLDVRVGIHVGEILIGNIGCADRINYTVCGTTANISARIEQLGKAYGVSPLISGDLHRQVEADFCCVWLDNVILQGHKTTVTPVYHLVAPMRTATGEQLAVSHAMAEVRDRSCQRGKLETVHEAIDAAEHADASGVYSKTLALLRARVLKKQHASDSFDIIPNDSRVAAPSVAL
eukprot:m51a1_g8045 hypothetical protein (714) ;mRNA; f:85365-87901